MKKGGGNMSNGDATTNNASRIGRKRPHQWFAGSGEPELLPNKKQAMEAPNNQSSADIPNSNVSCWENSSSLQSVPNQFIHRLFGPERSVSFAERSVSPVRANDLRQKSVDDNFRDDASVGLSISHSIEDPEASCFNYGGIRKVKVSRVKDSNNGLHISEENSLNREANIDSTTDQTYNKESQSSFMTVGQPYGKEDSNATLMGHTYNRGDAHVRTTESTYGKVEKGQLPISDAYSKEENMISFVGFDEHQIISMGQPISCYDPSYHQSSIQIPETTTEKQLNATNAGAIVIGSESMKPKPESVFKKPEFKMPKKEAPNSFPSNVRSLISTGMLDGVPVKYVSVSREELRGIIKGSGYLCGCQSCNYTKVLNAYEFERHAGCKTKHPNNHIYFENGKTIYQIVQELRSTPENLLFDTIQTVFGAPINQKSFRIWKESFQAATRELQRIYGKEELNL